MKTKITPVNFFVLLFLLSSISAFSQAPSWSWAVNSQNGSYDGTNAVTTDSSGNVYATGYFYGVTIDFGSLTLVNADPSGNKHDMFLVKYNNAGTVLWAQSAGGNNEDAGYSVATDISGNVYVTGYFFSPSITFDSIILYNQGDYDMFIVKYNSSGGVLWAKSAGRIDDDYGRCVTTDALKNVYVVGSYRSPSIIFGSTVLTNTDPTLNYYDMFLVKYDSAGIVQWAKGITGDSTDFARTVALDPFGNIYIGGTYESTALNFGSAGITNQGRYDAFFAKYNSAGMCLWARDAGGSEPDDGTCLATDPYGNIYISGAFGSSPMMFGGIPLNATGLFTMYLAKYDSSGTALWARATMGDGNDVGYDMFANTSGEYITGFYDSTSFSLGSTTLVNAGLRDIFIAKYDTAGTALWAKSVGGNDYDQAMSIATYGSDIYVGGYFRSASLNFGAALYNSDDDDMFLAKIKDNLSNGIYESGNSTEINVSPNPTNSLIMISGLKGPTLLELYNVLGEIIFSNKIDKEKVELDLSNELTGVYFLKITMEEGVFMKEIVRE